MKAVKGSDFIINIKGMSYQSYHQGWAKALDNFEKTRKDFGFRQKHYFQLHNN